MFEDSTYVLNIGVNVTQILAGLFIKGIGSMSKIYHTLLMFLYYGIVDYYFSLAIALVVCSVYNINTIGIFSEVTDVLFLSYFLLIVEILLILSGDVEKKPGPNTFDSCLSVFHQNIRSIRNKFDYIKTNFLDYDIVCFTESKLSFDIPNDSLHLDGFDKMYRKDNTTHSGGLLIYVSSGIYSKRILELEVILPESIWLEIKTEFKTYLLCNLYRPPNASVEIWDRINISMENALETCNNIILVGDLNEDQLNSNNNKLRNILLLNNMENVITEATRITPYLQTLLDPIGMSSSLECLFSGVYNTDKLISDHFGTFAYIRTRNQINDPFKRRVWNYKRANFEQLNEKIQNTDWSFLTLTDINTATKQFTDKFLNLAKTCIPTTMATIRPKDKPWYNSEIRKTT